MAYKSLHEFIEELERVGELKRIKTKVSPILEITEITDRVCKNQGPALLFEEVEGYSIPVLINAFGSMERMAKALGVNDINNLAAEIESLIKPEIPDTFIDKLKLIPKVSQLASFFPKKVSTGLCKEVTKDNLDFLPILKCWPEDGGRFLTLPIVITKNPQTEIRNLGMYRMQVYDSKTTGMHWHPHKVGAKHYQLYKELGEKMPVAVCLGGDPAITYAATAPLPDDIDELLFAGFLRKKPVEIVPCETIDLEVPANSEFVIEGYVDPQEEWRCEGPFGDHTGYYSLEDNFPVFHITGITHRKNPIYPATIVGKPPMEDCFMAKATERIFLPLIKLILPEIIDINLPIEGVFHNLALVSIKKSYPGQAKKVMHALWGLGQLMFTKIIVVVDENVDVQNGQEVIWRMGNNVDPMRDFVFVEGPVDTLDHAAPYSGFGSKVGIDATRKLKEEGFNRPWPEEIKMSKEVKKKIDSIWHELFK
ncbi:MAG: menaquinone biosynthesis decarboxylase [Nitrospirota bacterium]